MKTQHKTCKLTIARAAALTRGTVALVVCLALSTVRVGAEPRTLGITPFAATQSTGKSAPLHGLLLRRHVDAEG
jgi:hypothetical protein